MAFVVPPRLLARCRTNVDGLAWLERLPSVVHEVQRRWSLALGGPFSEDEGSCAWVAPAVRADGSSAVLKVGVPHTEAAHEIEGLRFWHGDPTVRLLEADDALYAMLLERCEPGRALRSCPEALQDVVIAGLLRRLWRTPPPGHPFRALSVMTDSWGSQTLLTVERWPDSGLVREGLQLLEALPRNAGEAALLATDLHAGNVLAAERSAWLVIDPKPFVGDPAYDATQHLFNTPARLIAEPLGTIRRFADSLDLDPERVRLWMFARAAAEPRQDWHTDPWLPLARSIAP